MNLLLCLDTFTRVFIARLTTGELLLDDLICVCRHRAHSYLVEFLPLTLEPVIPSIASFGMARIGFHASHEQFTPRDLLDHALAAEAAGFDSVMSSDHFHPWSERQGQSGFAWSWLGAAMQATFIPFGIISAPGYRYHPAVLAQAAATLLQMYPQRLWWALGSGQAINEAITGMAWPDKAERNARLKECVDVIRALFAGETVTHRGRITVVEAKL